MACGQCVQGLLVLAAQAKKGALMFGTQLVDSLGQLVMFLAQVPILVDYIGHGQVIGRHRPTQVDFEHAPCGTRKRVFGNGQFQPGVITVQQAKYA